MPVELPAVATVVNDDISTVDEAGVIVVAVSVLNAVDDRIVNEVPIFEPVADKLTAGPPAVGAVMNDVSAVDEASAVDPNTVDGEDTTDTVRGDKIDVATEDDEINSEVFEAGNENSGVYETVAGAVVDVGFKPSPPISDTALLEAVTVDISIGENNCSAVICALVAAGCGGAFDSEDEDVLVGEPSVDAKSLVSVAVSLVLC